ncbi:hypothetical protein BDV97DRAFT_366792 [Delphinella strobiligena]|nr:hypothetical protein BDV97DRAFT_366792 [Delphinella strobiligena]
MQAKTTDYQTHNFACLSRIHNLETDIRIHQRALADSDQLVYALAQERQHLYARQQQNDQLLGGFRARYMMVKERFDEQDEAIKGLRADLRRAQEENGALQGELVRRADGCARLAEEVGVARGRGWGRLGRWRGRGVSAGISEGSWRSRMRG